MAIEIGVALLELRAQVLDSPTAVPALRDQASNPANSLTRRLGALAALKYERKAAAAKY